MVSVHGGARRTLFLVRPHIYSSLLSRFLQLPEEPWQRPLASLPSRRLLQGSHRTPTPSLRSLQPLLSCRPSCPLAQLGPLPVVWGHWLTHNTACSSPAGLSVTQDVAGRDPVVTTHSGQEAEAGGERGPGAAVGWGVSVRSVVEAVGSPQSPATLLCAGVA